jgi:uncharacterized protein
MDDALTVTNNTAANQFEIDTGHGIARLKYVQRGEVLDLVHTDVPREAAGHGVGAALARAALEHARRDGLQVIATCPFVSSYLEKHREFRDLLATR